LGAGKHKKPLYLDGKTAFSIFLNDAW